MPTNASRLSDFGSGIGTAGAILQIDNANQRIGIGTTNPQAMLQVGTGVSVYGNSGIVSATAFYGDGSNLSGINISYVPTAGIATYATTAGIATYATTAGIATYATSAGIATYATTAGIATNAQGLTGTPDITVGNVVGSALTISGISTLSDLRLASIADKTVRVDGNNVSLSYSTGGGNVAICTNPSGAITLSVTNIPTDSSFDNRAISFAVIVQQGATAYACTSVTLNGVVFGADATAGVQTHIAYAGGTVAVGNTSSYDTFNFTGINTVGSASTTTNYKLLSNINGDYRLY